MDSQTKKTFLWLTLIKIIHVAGQTSLCSPPEATLPCICTNRHEDIQIWCTHSDLSQVLKGVQKIGEFIRRPIDELIIENNYLPSIPGKIFQNVKIRRLMLRHNGIERVTAAWLETQELDLVEIFIVENDLKNIPFESFIKLQNLQAVTIQSYNLKRIPPFNAMQRLKYINIQSGSLNAINENTFSNLPNLEKLFIQGSKSLHAIKENAFYNLPKLQKLYITDCGVQNVHIRALSLLLKLKDLSFSNNEITDATMVGRAIRDLPLLSTLNLNNNLIDKLNEGAFVDQPMLEILYLSHNNINIIHHGAFHRVPKLRVVDLSYNKIIRIHPESFLQQSSSGVEELSLIGNKIMHISEFRSLLDALPRLRFLDMSDNLLYEIPRGALRGHPSLERLHLNKNNIKFIEGNALVAMPALRELHLSNNSLGDMYEGPFWDLPALKGLDLSYNYFRRLEPKLLYNLPSLRRINLSGNEITIIDPITFMETPLLEYINVSGNLIVSVHPATFRNLPNLYEMDASSNKLIEFVPGLPRGLEQLKLQKNQITSLPMPPSPDLDLPALRTLDISNNGIQKIPHGSMKTLHNLRRLYMIRNGLRQIEDTTFSDLGNLEILDLGDNQIISLHPKSFNKLVHLKKINLHGNKIELFDFTTALDNPRLHILDFSKNKLKSISPNVVDKLLYIETLNISSNNLHEIPTLNMLPHLKILDASFNHIKHFDGNIIDNAQTIHEIKFPSNKIVELRTGSFRGLKSLEVIDLDNNKIEIIHPLAFTNLPKVMSVYLSRNHIIDIPDRVFTNMPQLRIIELQGNRLQFISTRAFENTPLVQYLNVSNNQITNIENTGLRLLSSLEVLDLSFNKLRKITQETFKYMEWLVELNLDNNYVCSINGRPFDAMPRLKVLSLRHNKLTSIFESNFLKLRNNIAILDIDGNPLVCNCAIIWLKSWLLESTSIGPKCVDGTYLKGMPFSRNDCLNYPIQEDAKSCMTYENEALLPNLATSQVFSSLDKISSYTTQQKNNYQNNKIYTRPTPEESEYFYDEYIDYPFNETFVGSFNNTTYNLTKDNFETKNLPNSPSLHINIKNTTEKNIPVSTNAPSAGFTFFGMPLPSIDIGKLINTGRKIDWFENKNAPHFNKYQSHPLEIPKFETGGFTPILPTTDGGFLPLSNPTMEISHRTQGPGMKYNDRKIANSNMEHVDKGFATVEKIPKLQVTAISRNNTIQTKVKNESHELKAIINEDVTTRNVHNKTKYIVDQNNDPVNLTKYHLMETNMSVTQITEKEGIITTDSNNDIYLQAWIETSTSQYFLNTKKPQIESQPTALSAVLVPNSEKLERQYIRPATVTKVSMPQLDHHVLYDNYTPVINREAKTRFSDINPHINYGSSRTKHANDKDWYYKNYNNSNLEPYISPGLQTKSRSNELSYNKLLVYCIAVCYLVYS